MSGIVCTLSSFVVRVLWYTNLGTKYIYHLMNKVLLLSWCFQQSCTNYSTVDVRHMRKPRRDFSWMKKTARKWWGGCERKALLRIIRERGSMQEASAMYPTATSDSGAAQAVSARVPREEEEGQTGRAERWHCRWEVPLWRHQVSVPSPNSSSYWHAKVIGVHCKVLCFWVSVTVIGDCHVTQGETSKLC